MNFKLQDVFLHKLSNPLCLANIIIIVKQVRILNHKIFCFFYIVGFYDIPSKFLFRPLLKYAIIT